jgi:hypothetical protein
MIKNIIFACLCIRIYGNGLNHHLVSKWVVYNQLRSDSSQLSEHVNSKITTIRGGSDENKDTNNHDEIEKPLNISKAPDDMNDHHIDDVEIIPFDEDQFIDSSDIEDIQEIKDEDINLLDAEQSTLNLEFTGDESESSHVEALSSDSDQYTLVEDLSVQDDDQNKEVEIELDALSEPIDKDLVYTSNDVDLQIPNEITDSYLEQKSETETSSTVDDIESHSILWRSTKPDAYNLKYKVTRKLKQWADKDKTLNDNDQSKELRLLLHNRAQTYVRDLIEFEENLETENSSKNIPHPKRVLHFIAPKIKAIKQSPYISLQIRGASQQDARVAASTLGVMAALIELYCTVRRNCDPNIGVGDTDVAKEVIEELMSDRRFQQVVECSLCGFENTPHSVSRSLDDTNDMHVNANNDADGSHIEVTDTKTESTIQHKHHDEFAICDAMRMTFGLTALSYDKYSNDTDISNVLTSCATNARDDIKRRIEHPPSVNLNEYYSQLSHDLAEFISVFAAATVHFRLNEQRAIKACFELLFKPLPKMSLKNSTNSSGTLQELVNETLLDYLSPESIIILVRSMSASASDFDENAEYESLVCKMNLIIDQYIELLNSTLADQHDLDSGEIECVDAAELLNFARESEYNTDDDNEYDDDSLEVQNPPEVDLSSIEFLRGETDLVPGSSKVKLSNDFVIQDFNDPSESRPTENVMISTRPMSFLLRRKRYKTTAENFSRPAISANEVGQVELRHQLSTESSIDLSFDDLCSILVSLKSQNSATIGKIMVLIKEKSHTFIASASDYDLLNLICACLLHIGEFRVSNDVLYVAMEEFMTRNVHETLDLNDLLRFIESLSDMQNPDDFLIQISNKSKLHLIFDRVLQDVPDNMPSVDRIVKFLHSYAKWRFWGSRGKRQIGWDRFENLGYLVQHCFHCIERDEGCGDTFRRINSSMLLSYTVALLGIRGSDIVHQTLTVAQNCSDDILSQNLKHIIGLLFAQAKYIEAIKSEEHKELIDQIIKVACQSKELKELDPSYYALFIWSIGVLRDTSSEAFDFQRSHNIPVYTRDELRCLSPTISVLLVSIYCSYVLIFL